MREADSVSALVQEADVAERVVVLKVRVPGRTSVAIVGAGKAGLVPTGARQEAWGGRLPPGAPRQRAREEALAGAKLLALSETAAFVEQGGVRRVIKMHGPRVVVTDETTQEGAVDFASASDAQRALWEERGRDIVAEIAHGALDLRRAEILKVLDRAATRIERRRRAVEEDLAKIGQADLIAAQAQWLIAEAARTPRGATKMVVTDWTSGEPTTIEVPLDPSKSAREQVDAMFKRAKRLRLGGRIASERKTEALRQLDAVLSAARRVTEATTIAAAEEAAREAKRAAPRDVSLNTPSGPAAGKKKGTGRTPHRTFSARSGRRILVGKGASDNDTLTLKIARPHDLWVHAKERTGAHVIVPLDRGKTAASEDLVDAAHLAAHFSDAREEKVVDIQYTDRRFLRKPKGSPPGLVIVDREKVLVLRVEPAILRTLLEREDV